MSLEQRGVVQAHTVIRVPDRAHAGQAPFVLLLVALDGGRRVLGHYDRLEPPAIGSRVVSTTIHPETRKPPVAATSGPPPWEWRPEGATE